MLDRRAIRTIFPLSFKDIKDSLQFNGNGKPNVPMKMNDRIRENF
jgi:hypothetical protein